MINDEADRRIEHRDAVIDAKKKALKYLNINISHISDEGINDIVTEIFDNKYSIAKISNANDRVYKISMSGKLNMRKVRQYSNKKLTTKNAANGVVMLIAGIGAVILVVGLWNDFEELVEWK